MSFLAGSIISKLILDDSDWNKKSDKAKKDLDQMGGHAEKASLNYEDMGRQASVAGGVIIGILGGMTKKASDYEEATSKFGTIFEDVMGDATVSVKELTSSYGLSSQASKVMLGNTGDLLTGLGMQSDKALELSTRTQKMAVDLASFTNIEGGATRASEAITKAMLGENEMMKALGVTINEKMVKQKLEILGASKATGASLLRAKAEAKMMIIQEQSKNAMADYARTSDSTANVQRELGARVSDLTVKIGSSLTPVLRNLASMAVNVVEAVTGWADENPVLAGTVARVAGAVGAVLLVGGPLLIIIPKIATAIVGLKTAMTSFSPVLAGITVAVVAVTSAIGAWTTASNKRIKELVNTANIEAKTYQKLRDYRRIASEEEKQIIKTSTRLYMALGYTLHEASAQVVKDLQKNSKAFQGWNKIVVNTTKENSEKTKSLMEQMTTRIKELTMDEYKYKEYLVNKSYQDNLKNLKAQNANAEAFSLAKQQRDLELADIEKEREASKTANLKKEVSTRAGIWGLYYQSVEKVMSEHKSFTDEMRLMRDEANASDDEKELLRLEAWKTRLESKINGEVSSTELKNQKLNLLDEAYTARRDEILRKQAENDTKTTKMTFANYVQIATSSLNIISKIFQASYNRRLKKLNAWYDKERKAIEMSTMNEEEKAKAIENLDKEMSDKKLALARKNAKREKAVAIAGAIMNTAQAVTSALTAKPWTPANFVMAGIAGAMGLAQVAVIASQPLPAMAEGGMTTGEGIAMLHPNEVVMPLEKLAEGGTLGGMGKSLTVVFEIREPIDSQSFNTMIRERAIPVIQDALNDEILIVNPEAVRST